jgi:hypothetical protein
MGKWAALFFCLVFCSTMAAGQTLNCDLHGYKPLDGLEAAVHPGALTVTWQGERGEKLRVEFTLRHAQPLIHELAARKPGSPWAILGHDLTPEFQVTSGQRRISTTQVSALEHAFGTITPAMVEKEKWNTFWDAPLNIPRTEGGSDSSAGLPRMPEEIRRASAAFHLSGCEVKTDGARLEVSFPGLEMGIFSGRLQFTVYRGANLLRQEAIAKTAEPSVAYKYSAGLKGFGLETATRLVWQDTARAWQEYDFGGAGNDDSVELRARNRLALVEMGGGSLAVFPAPHKFFFARENGVNLGYVYYRQDGKQSFAVGVCQPDHGEGYHPYGVTLDVWKRRVAESRDETGNYALYNAPAGSWQRMAVYFYLDAEGSRPADRHVLAYTHDDVYKPLAGYQVLVSHFHFHLLEKLNDRGSLDYHPPFVDVMRALGINIVILADFHSDSHPNDSGPLRLKEQKVYFDGCERLSDRNFLLIPGEEPNQFLGGHYMMLLPRPVFWTHNPTPPRGQAFSEDLQPFGKVYNTASAAQVMDLLTREKGVVWQAHPRTKASAGYPDAVRHKDHFLGDSFIGASWESLPVDLSEKRLCEVRCFGTLDDMSDWAPRPKYMIAEGDTYSTYPDDEAYPQLAVNYVKLERLPRFHDGWSPVVEALKAGDFFVTTGEVLLHHWAIQGSGSQRVYTADVEWTFPLDLAELVWSDGDLVRRQILSTTTLPPFSRHVFRIPFEATGKRWIRFAAWDSAGNGAFTQPVVLK